MLFAYYVSYLKFSLSSDSSSADSKRVPDVSEALDPTDLSPSASSVLYLVYPDRRRRQYYRRDRRECVHVPAAPVRAPMHSIHGTAVLILRK
jgi:hypothetical protein